MGFLIKPPLADQVSRADAILYPNKRQTHAMRTEAIVASWRPFPQSFRTVGGNMGDMTAKYSEYVLLRLYHSFSARRSHPDLG